MINVVKSDGFLPTDEELGLVTQIYERAGCLRPGHIEGNTVAEIFSTAAVDLAPFILTAIWDLADGSKSGYLSETDVAIALRLIGWAQSGEKVTAALVNENGPLPRIKGLNESNANPLNWPPFTESIRDASQKLFEECGPVYGLLEGDKARDAFLVFNLTPKDIWKIWDVSDTRKRGALDKYDFALAIYLIQCVQTGKLSTIPPTTPPQVYEQIRSVSVSPKFPPPPSPQILNTSVRPRKPTRPPPIITSTVLPEKSPQSAPTVTNAGGWSVSPSAKATAEQDFDGLDTLKVGYIEADVVAKFMRKFELIPEDLALIWDLADLNHDCRLTHDEFVIAMHLIEQRINGVELPSVLPTSLIPPSLRAQSPHPPLRRSTTSSSRPMAVFRAHNNTTTGSPPLPPKPTYPNHRHSVSISNHKAISSKSPLTLWNSRHSIAIPPVKEIDVEPSPVLNSKPEPQTVSFEQYRALEQQHASLSSKVEKLSAQISAQQDPFVAGEHVSLDQYRLLEEENSRLSANIKDLTSQIDALHNVQTENETLSQDKARLFAKIQEMEQITSDLLQSNEATLMVEQLGIHNAELERRVSELEQLPLQLEDATRRLNNALEEKRDLSQRLREARESAEAESRRAAMEMENMKKSIEILDMDKEGLRIRAETLQQSFMKAGLNSKGIPEMEILMGDVTRENESLKQRLRQMENSTANLLLTTNGHAEQEKLRRTNQELTSQIHDLEQLVTELQRSSEEVELQRMLKDVTMENDQLKGSLREMELEVTRLQQTVRQVDPLKAEVEELKADIRRLHVENLRAHAQVEESSGPPPAYDDDPFH